MIKPFNQLLLGASVCIGVGVMANAPALAGSLTNSTISGSAPYLTYDANSTNTFKVDNTTTNLVKVLGGGTDNPTGNVELFSNSETLSNEQFKAYKGTTNLTGKIGGRDITFSSLTWDEWQTDLGQGKSLGQTWFDEALKANGLGNIAATPTSAALFSVFSQYGGLQRFSDPNIAYVNQNNKTGQIQVGLAGHFDAAPLLSQSFNLYVQEKTAIAQQQAAIIQQKADTVRQLSAFISTNQRKPNMVEQVRQANQQLQQLNQEIQQATKIAQQAGMEAAQAKGFVSLISDKPLQASELVKYTHNGKTGYLYSFTGKQSGLVEQGDGVSHNAIYEAAIAGEPNQSVPEPSLMLGFAALGSFFVANRKQK